MNESTSAVNRPGTPGANPSNVSRLRKLYGAADAFCKRHTLALFVILGAECLVWLLLDIAKDHQITLHTLLQHL